MLVKENENNTDQYEYYEVDKSSKVEFTKDVLINRSRFRVMKELHMNKYSSASNFWEMFERDLFDLDK